MAMDWKSGPPVLVGEKVFWFRNLHNKPMGGVVKWIGNIPEISSDWCVGIELDIASPGLECNGFWKNRKLFECRENHGLIAPAEEIHKINSEAIISALENNFRLPLDDSQFRDFTSSNPRGKSFAKIQEKNFYSNLKLNPLLKTLGNRTSDWEEKKKVYQLRTAGVLGEALNGKKASMRKSQDVKALLHEEKAGRKSPRKSERNSQGLLNPFPDFNFKGNLETAQKSNLKTHLSKPLINMDEIAGYFKEIKEGEERSENENKMEDLALYGMSNATEPGQSKPKKLFSFLKWFNKKQKHEPNLKLFKETSAASSPVFPRKQTSSCESIDTVFSTQTVRSFAYIPPTQYVPSAPPLELDKSSCEKLCDNDSLRKNQSEETESIYERKKKRKAPEPPRLSRENSLPTTLERKINEEDDFDGIKTYHRRTVSESFKDKKAGAYCHVQGKRKAPPPPGSPLYPNLQKLDNQYSSLNKKKKPAPPPPELNFKNQNPGEVQGTLKDSQEKNDITRLNKGIQKEKRKDSKDNGISGKDEKKIKISQSSKAGLTKDSSLSPLSSRPWYKRNHRDSTGTNIIRKDLQKGFDKKKNKESDDWMPEVGFSRRSLSSESSQNKFNVFSKLEKIEDKKKEEKRKSQISILTNISELDREAAEIVKKEQAEGKKMMAENDAKYYSRKKDEKPQNFPENLTNEKGYCNGNNIDTSIKNKAKANEQDGKWTIESNDGILKAQTIFNDINTRQMRDDKNQSIKKEKTKIKEDKEVEGKENFSNTEDLSKEDPKESALPPLVDFTSPSSQTPAEKATKMSQNPSRLNHFKVENKNLNYLNEPWVCKKCTLENPGWRVFCEICNCVKPRFLFKKPSQNTEVSKEKKKENLPRNSQKTEKIEKFEEVTSKQENKNQATKVAEEEKEETKVTEILDDLRKKRLTFFTSKLGTLYESVSSRNAENKPLTNSAVVTQSGTADFWLKDKLEEGKSSENTTAVAVVKESIREYTNSPEGFEELPAPKEILKSNEVLINQNAHGDSNCEVINQSLPTSENSQVIEAYVVTKTVVLEDIIVRKPERGRKTSASMQTKFKLPTFTEPKMITPPPRTKKSVVDASAKATEAQSGNEFERVGRNHRQEEIEKLTNKLTQRDGLADFRANIETMAPNTEMNTVAVNRLLRKLEMAISCGDHLTAGGLAKELALMKIDCSVTRQVTPSPSTSNIIVDLYIEDKVSHQGPIPIEVSPTISVLQLKHKVQQELGIPVEVQRWILGKKLATDNNKTLEAEGIKSNCFPVFLYLVAPGNQKPNEAGPANSDKPKSNEESFQISEPTRNCSFSVRRKGWYYNYEEDRYSYCEDSEDEQNDCSSDISNKSKEISPSFENINSNTTMKSFDTEIGIKMEGVPPPVVDLKTRDIVNDLDKELKLISANSVKQKVEQLNKTYVESTKGVKPPLGLSRMPETWKCGACNFVNLTRKLNCSSCGIKKVSGGPQNRNLEKDQNEERMNKEEDDKGGRTKKVKKFVKEDILEKENLKPIISETNVHYKALIELQDADLVPNNDPFNCSICLVDFAPGEGVTLKDCLHTFCRTCLESTVQFSEDAEVKCPYLDETYSCPSVLQQREIKALVPRGVFELHLAKSIKEAENKINNAFHCKTPDCKGWCIYEDNVNEFHCPVCKLTNCLTCQAVHSGINCREFQDRMKDAAETDVDAKKSTDVLIDMVEKGEAMVCPKCQVVLMKKWGCDWLKCSMCKTEICWVTRGFRWGPEGKGDTSGGCRCGVNGKKCHPKCNYCH